MPNGHAKFFGASNSARWLTCLGSVQQEEGKPNKGNDDARLGTAAHFLASECLSRNLIVAEQLGRSIYITETNGESWEPVEGAEPIVIDDDMVRHITAYVEFVRHLVETTGGELFVEQRVSYRDWLPPIVEDDDGFGTSDVIITTPDEIIVVDLKYGQGVEVFADDNTQMQLYALGSYAEHSVFNIFEQARMIIFQPRIKSAPSEWVIPIGDLLAFGEEVRAVATRILTEDNLPLAPSDKACQFCKAKADCPELQRMVLETVFGDLEDLDAAEPRIVPTIELPVVWKKRDMIRGFLSAIEERMLEETHAGTFPNFKVVEGRKGNRVWEDPSKAEETMKSMRLKHDQMYSYTLISPTTAEKLLKDKPRSWNRIKALIKQPPGKDTIAPIDDPRPARAKVADAFNDEDLFN